MSIVITFYIQQLKHNFSGFLIFKYQKNAVTTVYIFPPIFLKAWVAHLNAICCMFGSVT